MYYVYILLSLKDNNFYIGYTFSLKRRLLEHKNSKVKSTKNRKPLKLLYFEAYLFKKEAMNRKNILKVAMTKKI
jgi:putative endonuclease